jgi:hypothetical protein
VHQGCLFAPRHVSAAANIPTAASAAVVADYDTFPQAGMPVAADGRADDPVTYILVDRESRGPSKLHHPTMDIYPCQARRLHVRANAMDTGKGRQTDPHSIRPISMLPSVSRETSIDTLVSPPTMKSNYPQTRPMSRPSPQGTPDRQIHCLYHVPERTCPPFGSGLDSNAGVLVYNACACIQGPGRVHILARSKHACRRHDQDPDKQVHTRQKRESQSRHTERQRH